MLLIIPLINQRLKVEIKEEEEKVRKKYIKNKNDKK